MRVALIAFVMAVVADTASVQADPNTLAQVRLKDGRVITGRMLPSEDEATILIGSSVPGIRMTTRVAVENIDSIRKDSRDHSQDKAGGKPRPVERPLKHERRISQARSLPDSGRRTPITHIDVDAGPVNWDTDPAVDGLELWLRVHDAGRSLRHVPGQLTVRLTGILQPDQTWQYAGNRRNPVKLLESWSVPVALHQFHEGVAVVKLPFRRFHPQEDLAVAPWGGIEVSYSVSSVGVFRTQLTDIALRSPSLFRDDLQLTTGRRTFPGEVNRLPDDGHSPLLLRPQQMR